MRDTGMAGPIGQAGWEATGPVEAARSLAARHAGTSHRPARRLGALLAGLWLLLLPIPGSAQDSPASAPTPRRSPRPPAAPAVVVKYRASGPHALRVCADRISSQGESFQPHLADGSDSLDRIRRQFRLGRQKALFRKPSDQPLAVARAAQRARFAKGRRPSGTSGERPLPDLAHLYRIEVPADVSRDALIAALRSDPHVAWVQPDHDLVLDQAVPFDDPFLSSAGTWGQPYADLWGPDFIRAPEVWPVAQGEGVVVAVVDTGLDAEHPDIAANVWVHPGEDLDGNGLADAADRNGIDDDGNGFIDDLTGFDFANSVDANEDGDYDDPGDVSDADPRDDNGHGTHVAGTIAAVANNGIGIVGVAPRAKIMALKGFPESGSASDTDLWRAVLYAAENGAAVVNNSWSCSSPCPVNPLAEEVLELVEALGTVVVTSAGNKGEDVAFYSPENGDRVITVGAVGFEGVLPAFTNRGWLVDVVAPGGGPDEPLSVPVARQNILSLRAEGTREDEPRFIVDDAYLRLAGTSMSSPHVAGAVAVLRGLRPELTPAEVRLLLRLSARALGAPGFDPYFGAGALDLVRLVDTPLPDLRLASLSPRVGRIHDPATGPIVVEAIAAGDDLEAIEVSIARGLSGREFVPLESFGDSTLDWTPGVGGAGEGASPVRIATWDVEDVADGPQVIRVRARLRDGRVADEFTIVGLERNAPRRLSEGALDTSLPDLADGGLVWRVAEPIESIITGDLVVGRYPLPSKGPSHESRVFEQRLELEGDQRSPVRDGAELAWLEATASGGRTVARCRLQSSKHCDPRPVSGESGLFGAPMLAGGWLVWSRTSGSDRFIEGCPVGAGSPACVPRSLVDPASGVDWNLASFDGRTLLVSRPGQLARCRVEASGPCLPVPIDFPSGVSPIEPKHDGDSLVFSRIDIGFEPPPGCARFDPRLGCAAQVGVLVTYLACSIDPSSSFCDPFVVSDRQPIERALGFAVSGRRVVWAMGSEEELPVLRFCEIELGARACRVQRLGGALAAQTEPTIDGPRLAWSDGRAGEVAVHGVVVPDLSGPASRTLKAGLAFSIGLDAAPGSSTSLRYEIEALEGLTPEAAFVSVVDGGQPGGRVALVGRIPATAAGPARWRVRAVGSGGYVSEHGISLEIVPRPPPR